MRKVKITIDTDVPDEGIWAIMILDDDTYHIFTEENDDWDPLPGRIIVHKTTGKTIGPIKHLIIPYSDFILRSS